ncbi:MAG: glycosyltransferase family protein [Bacteroidetes bacterium]|nr:glycosyltransferase family protein [Bacteroidota bacterium]
MKATAIIQARTGSTRFPSKVFAPLAGKPLLWHIVNRLTFCKKIDNIIVATTTNKPDDEIETWAHENKIQVFRGSEEDVLARYYGAAKFCKANTIVRVTADDPFKDPEIIDKVIELLEVENLDFACNNNPPSFPEGLDTEVFTFKAIEKAYLNSADAFEREHVTQYFHRNTLSFKMGNISNRKNFSQIRLTIDTPADYEMAVKIYDALYQEARCFMFKDIIEFLKKYPDVITINQNEKRSYMYVK